MKVLIAEDDKFLVSAYRLKFEKEGDQVEVALDGQEALEKLKTFKPDVVLLDLMMPKMDGFEFLEELKKAGSCEAPIIVASNLSQAEDVERAKKLGAVDFVVKSDVALDELVAKVKSYAKTA